MSDEATDATPDDGSTDDDGPGGSGTLRSAAFLCSVFAGLSVGVGALLTWATFGPNDPNLTVLNQVYKGVDLSEGTTAFVCAIVLLVGALVFRRLGRPGRTAVAALMIVAGVVAVGAAGATILTVGTRLEDQAVDAMVQTAVASGADAGEAESAIREQIDEIGATTSLGAGIWLTLAGGFLGFIGGTLSLAYAVRLDDDDEGVVPAI